MLLTGSPTISGPEYAAFNKALGELGWVEGQTLVIDRRWADTSELFITLAADVVREKPVVIQTTGPAATRAVQQATSMVPRS